MERMIILHLQSIDQLIEPHAPSPFIMSRLWKHAEKFLIDHARELPRDSCAELNLHLPEGELSRANLVPAAFAQHFAFRRLEAEQELKRIRRFGWRSLLVGLSFLMLMMLLVEVLKRYVPATPLSSVLQEGVTILAWVALWRPGELLLYEWYPSKRDSRLFRKLECAQIRIIPDK